MCCALYFAVAKFELLIAGGQALCEFALFRFVPLPLSNIDSDYNFRLPARKGQSIRSDLYIDDGSVFLSMAPDADALISILDRIHAFQQSGNIIRRADVFDCHG